MRLHVLFMSICQRRRFCDETCHTDLVALLSRSCEMYFAIICPLMKLPLSSESSWRQSRSLLEKF